mmetsp:Transcript_31539/g.60190  ORF Transcript_31539/g.60190 Transcript_31539/m.60190 type:complete len:204 (-) Transcript_31539:2202-2813(-)
MVPRSTHGSPWRVGCHEGPAVGTGLIVGIALVMMVDDDGADDEGSATGPSIGTKTKMPLSSYAYCPSGSRLPSASYRAPSNSSRPSRLPFVSPLIKLPSLSYQLPSSPYVPPFPCPTYTPSALYSPSASTFPYSSYPPCIIVPSGFTPHIKSPSSSYSPSTSGLPSPLYRPQMGSPSKFTPSTGSRSSAILQCIISFSVNSFR